MPERGRRALGKAKADGWEIALISNQAGVVKGYLSQADVIAGFTVTMALSLNLITSAYWCPDWEGQEGLRLTVRAREKVCTFDILTLPEDDLGGFRKPGGALGAIAMADYGATPETIRMVGDMQTDLEFAQRLEIDFIWAADWWEEVA